MSSRHHPMPASPDDDAQAATSAPEPGITRSVADPLATTDGPGTRASTPQSSPERYRLGDEIARGGMGVVYRAIDTVLGREVAVKVLQDTFAPTSGTARRFADEARIAGQLQHPGIPPVHDLGTLPDGRPFLAMKLIKGDTLDDLLKARPDPSADRGRFVAAFEQICNALAYAHAHDVIHRDLKPANVMVGAFGEVQVMDWGLAKVLASRERERPEDPDETAAGTQVVSLRESDGSFTQAGSVLGTPAFMPPEQAVGAVTKIDARSDVFGLGAVLAVILTGRPPFAGSSAETTRVKAAQGDVAECFARLDSCGAEPDLVALCKRCLSPKQDDRPANAGVVARAVVGLRAVADERARQAELDKVRVEGEKAAAELQAAEQRKRRKVQLALAGAVVVLLLASGAFAWYSDRQERNRRAEQVDNERNERERLSRNAQALDALGITCEDSLRAGDADKAAGALNEIDRRLPEGGGDDLRGRFDAFRLDLAVLKDLEAADHFFWSVDLRERDMRAVAERWRAAFERFGIDLGRHPADEVVRRVAGSAIRDRLIATLDRWLALGGWLDRARAPLAEIRLVLRGIDPDQYRDACRDALLALDRAKVTELAGRPEALTQPSWFAVVLGENGAIPVQRRRTLLLATHQRQPGHFILLMGLGATYPFNQREGVEERLRWYQAAVVVAPRHAAAHNCLGEALFFRDLDAAVQEFRTAIRLDPTYAWAHGNLGGTLRLRGDLDEAVAELRESIRLDPEHELVHHNLGLALVDKGEIEEAITAFRAAIRVSPKNAWSAWPFTALGRLLHDKGDLDGGIAALQEALRRNPDQIAEPHHLMGWALGDKGDLDGAISECRKAIQIDPKHPKAQERLRQTERWRELLPRLSEYAAGRVQPKTPAEACELALLCTKPFVRRYALSARLYTKAFADDPKLAENRDSGHRYEAACAAALAAAGQGTDTAALNLAERSAHRAQALVWLQADLTHLKSLAHSTSKAIRTSVTFDLTHLQRDLDFSALRPGLKRIALPESERAEWDAFWADVNATLAEARKPPPPPEVAPPPRAVTPSTQR